MRKKKCEPLPDGCVCITNPCNNLITISKVVLKKGDKICLKVVSNSGICYLKLEGSITYLDIAYDKLHEAYVDDAATKIQYITSRPANLPCPGAPFDNEPQTATAGSTYLPTPPFAPLKLFHGLLTLLRGELVRRQLTLIQLHHQNLYLMVYLLIPHLLLKIFIISMHLFPIFWLIMRDYLSLVKMPFQKIVIV